MTIFSINSGSFGDVTVTGIVSASTLKGDGSQITSVSYDNIASKPTLISSSTQVTALLPEGTFSSSVQVDITNTTGYSTFSGSLATIDTTQTNRLNTIESVTGSYATTGSNTFTGAQTFSDTTNTTSYLDGAIHVMGGMSVRKDVRVSGSVTINGLLTAVSMSTQYVTSSEYNVGVSRITLNDDDNVRFAGISIYDSGSSSPTSASIFWDSLQHRFIYENLSGSAYNSSIIMAGPKHTGTLGDEVGLTSGYIPYATGDDHIDNSVMYQSGSNVGIGTTSPSARLDVYGNATLTRTSTLATTTTLTIGGARNNSGNDYAKITFQNYDSNNSAVDYIGAEIASQNDGTATDNGSLVFRVASNAVVSDAMVIRGSGNVGIGTTSPSSRLHVTGSTGGVFEVDAAGGTTSLYVSASGNVGIGTTKPEQLFVLAKSNNGITDGSSNNILRFVDTDTTSGAGQGIGAIQFYSADATNPGVKSAIRVISTGASSGGYFEFDAAANGGPLFNIARLQVPAATSGSVFNLITPTTTDITALYFSDSENTGRGKVSYDHSTDSMTFDTLSTTRLFINSSGNVGIGTTSPVTLKSATTLQVYGNIKIGNANDRGLLSLGDVASTGANAGIWRGAAGAYGSAGNYLNLGGYDGITFTTGNAEIASQTERMRIDSAGRVGIGTTSPVNPGLDIRTTGAAFSSTATKNSNMMGLTLTATANENTMTGVWFATGGENHWSGIAGARSNYTTNWATHLAFYTHVNDTSNLNDTTEKMRITGEGNVGINTTGPTSTLSVRGSTNLGDSQESSLSSTHQTRISGYALRYDASNRYGNYGNIILHASNGWTSSARRFLISNGLGANKFAIIRSVDASTDPAFGDGGVISSGTADFVIDNAGNVGIGTTSPSFPLDVQSNSSANGIKIRGRNNSGTDEGSLSFMKYDGTTTQGYIQSDSTNLTIYAITDLKLGGGNSVDMTIKSDGKVGIGTTNPSTYSKLHVYGTTGAIASPGLVYVENTDDAYALYIKNAGNSAQNDRAIFEAIVGSTSVFRVNNSGYIGIGTTSPGAILDIRKSNSGGVGPTLSLINGASTANGNAVDINMAGNPGGGALAPTARIRLTEDASANATLSFWTYSASGGSLTERARITSGGDVYIGKTSRNFASAGWDIEVAGDSHITALDNLLVAFNRQNTDGTLVEFAQAGTVEGNISVSGTTVSYNGGHLARWSQTIDNDRPNGLLKGTVLSNLDQMAVWIDPETGESQSNEQLNCMKVSDVEGDPNVAGVFVNWDNDDDVFTNDMNVAMTGDMIIRIAEGITVQRGDLLISAGDGTAKPQLDDIIRGNTIAKVTSTYVTCTYEDGSYCVPCVLMAC